MPEWTDMLTLAGLGFFGTGHCIGMCGPIVLAVPARSGRFVPQLLYHGGRVSTYVLIGAAVGLLGGENPLAGVAVMETAMSVVAALFLALFAAVRVGLMAEPKFLMGPSPMRIPGFTRITKEASGGSSAAMLLWGMMLGTLPCGLSYAALARALPAGSATKGALLLLAFGIGTLPGLLLLGTAGAPFFARHRKLSDLISGAIMAGMAVVLLVDAAGAYW